jgi:hypothetical protein
MLWAVASSAFVIYLYRKLNAEEDVGAVDPAIGSPASSPGIGPVNTIDVEFDRLNERISALESKLSKAYVRSPRQ